MSRAHPSLFDDDSANAAADAALVPQARKAPLNKREQTVDRLLSKVELLKGRVDEERRRLDELLVLHAAHIRPRALRLIGLRKEVVKALRPFLDDPRLKDGDRRVLRIVVAGQVDNILADDEAPDAEIHELFERLHGIAFAEAAQEQLDQARAEMAAVFDELGLDIDVPELRPDMSTEEVAAAAAQVTDRMQQAEEARVGGRAARRKKTKQEIKRETREQERLQRFERLRKLSIGAIYRRLAKALHPDLERDADLRERKSAVMQEVTAAYARNDLHTLLRLELEWLDGERTDGARLADETLDAYTQFLKHQIADLEAECLELRFHPRYQPLLVEGAFGMPALLDGRAEVQRLDLLIEDLSGTLERMAAGKVRREIRDIIRAHRRADRARPRY